MRGEKGGGTFVWKYRKGGFPRRGGGVVHTCAGRVSRGGGGAIFFFSGPKCPPRPCHTKNTTVIVIQYGVVANSTAVVKHYGRVSETPCFPGKIHRKSPQIVNTTPQSF